MWLALFVSNSTPHSDMTGSAAAHPRLRTQCLTLRDISVIILLVFVPRTVIIVTLSVPIFDDVIAHVEVLYDLEIPPPLVTMIN